MGIESEQLVFDYLSRVGDLAQQRGLPPAARMRLVSGLRTEIEAQRADSVVGTKRLLARLGTPEALVEAAGGAPAAAGTPRPEPAPPAPPARSAARDRLGALTAWRDGLLAKAAPKDRAEDRAAEERAAEGDGAANGHGRATGGGAPRNGDRPGSGRCGLFTKGAGFGKGPASGKVPGPRAGEPESAPSVGLPPHLAGADELGDAQDAPDWWRVEPGPYGPGDTVPGFVGGIEIPEMWQHPKGDSAGRPSSLRKDGTEADGDADGETARARVKGGAGGGADEGAGGDGEAVEAVEAVRPVPLRAWLSPVPALAVVLLVAGAVLGSWLALAGGWALAYVSRRLSPAEAKFAALGVPGTVVGGLLVWLWGRFDGRWGEPIAQGRLGQELMAALPGVVRVAAVASALFLLWRMRRAAR
ncbi:hypothetical protein [Streptomyces endophytica]|uniref:Integral membrane protein n=1 Tax=Streptomyces endophytica TaxID=2991496 RepID=A0ABY6P885_9ACTN|nr:hypothetical protein [Streptomyces endophytica]UZJ30024.1 hypothetical protein OJ254_05805 [Streptomyces endophytica]